MQSLHTYEVHSCLDSTFQTLFYPVTEASIRSWNLKKVKSAVCYTSLLFNETGISGKFYNNSLHIHARSEFLLDTDTNVIYFHEQEL